MTCSTCHEVETIASETRCRPCQAAYVREYRRTVQTLGLRTAHKAGRESFREDAIRAFEKIDGELTRQNATVILTRIE